jgi:penicillin amidase
MRVLLSLLLLFLSTVPGQAQDGPAEAMAKAKEVLARIDGEQRLPGLLEPVEVLRDRWGIAHIYAKNDHDLFFAQGYVAAQDRLFQIELWRRQAAGEMAEAFGAEYVAADRFARLLKYRGDMDAEWRSYSPDARAIAAAFTQGINAGIDQFGDQLPVEFHILKFQPKKWRPEDVLGRMSGIYMSQNFQKEIQRVQLVAAVGLDKTRWLAPVDPAHDYTCALSREDLKGIDARILADYEAATKALTFTPAKTQSNNWVVSGQRSASGKPLLASDPHRAIALPSLRYLVHLHAPGWNVIGSGEPALPGVAIGHNERIAWGFTIIGTDQADFYVEETNPAQPDEYKAEGRWQKMAVVRETIAVRGKQAETVALKYTRHGPVLFHDTEGHRAHALRWVGTEPGGAAYLRSLAVDRAQNRQEFLQAMGSWKVPGLNFVYADMEGNIGWIAAAETPVRPRHDGLLPVPGDSGFEWEGYLGVADLPQQFNPPRGWLATANHNILPEGYRHQIGYEFAAPFRIGRIRQLLGSRETWDLGDFRAIQHDDLSLAGLAAVRLLKEVDLQDARLKPYQTLLTDWDGHLSVDAKAGPLLAIWLRVLQEEFYGLHVSKELRPILIALSGLPVMFKALESADVRWLGADAKTARAQLLRSTLAKAVEQLAALPAAEQARWGALHTATFHHPLTTLKPTLKPAFDLGPVERPGDSTTPNNTRYDDHYKQIHGASYRHLFDLADWDRCLATSTPGQSGQPGSPHYADLLPLWARGEYFPLCYSRGKVEGVTQNRLLLKP